MRRYVCRMVMRASQITEDGPNSRERWAPGTYVERWTDLRATMYVKDGWGGEYGEGLHKVICREAVGGRVTRKRYYRYYCNLGRGLLFCFVLFEKGLTKLERIIYSEFLGGLCAQGRKTEMAGQGRNGHHPRRRRRHRPCQLAVVRVTVISSRWRLGCAQLG